MFKPQNKGDKAVSKPEENKSATTEGDDEGPVLTPKEFKNRLLELGFLNSDIIRRNNILVLAGEDNLLSQHEFYVMFEQHLEDEAMYEREKVPKPEDDLIFVPPPTETPGNLFINVVEARDLSLPTGWMSKKGKDGKTLRNSRLINIGAPSTSDVAGTSNVDFNQACILSAHLKRADKKVSTKNDVSNGENIANEETKVNEGNDENKDSANQQEKKNKGDDHDWQVTLFLDRPIMLCEKVLNEEVLKARVAKEDKKAVDVADAEKKEVDEAKEEEEEEKKENALLKKENTFFIEVKDYGLSIYLPSPRTESPR